MSIFSEKERSRAADIGDLGFTNPFLKARIELERKILGDAFVSIHNFWNATASTDENSNVEQITQIARKMLRAARKRWADGGRFAGSEEREIYRRLALFVLYYHCEESLYQYILNSTPSALAFDAFEAEVNRYLPKDTAGGFNDADAVHLYALFFTVRRAFHFTFRYIYGGSRAAAELRAAVWESIFTSSMARYQRSLYGRMDRISTLILGETGTGKELTAGAIGMSRYIPFDRRKRDFAAPFAKHYLPLNLTALTPSLIEAELFGYVRGAFTGAQKDSEGFLGQGGPYCTLFLDEVGDVSADIQVKLLRVLQSGEYTPVGTRVTRRFEGKTIAATNLDLHAMMGEKRFRADLYFRLCSDVIRTPTLAEQIAEDPSELSTIVRRLACNIAGEGECDGLTEETVRFIETRMPQNYSWPGNTRELEQCVCNVLVRGSYAPITDVDSSAMSVERLFQMGRLTADELVRTYCARVYSQTGSYVETAKRLGLDRRTVKARVDETLRSRGSV